MAIYIDYISVHPSTGNQIPAVVPPDAANIFARITTNDVNTDASAINNAIRNILLTKKESIPGNPEFGCDIYEVLFDQIDSLTISLMKDYIFTALKQWEPRIIVDNVLIKQIPEYNKLVATILYRYNDAGLDVNSQVSVAFT